MCTNSFLAPRPSAASSVSVPLPRSPSLGFTDPTCPTPSTRTSTTSRPATRAEASRSTWSTLRPRPFHRQAVDTPWCRLSLRTTPWFGPPRATCLCDDCEYILSRYDTVTYVSLQPFNHSLHCCSSPYTVATRIDISQHTLSICRTLYPCSLTLYSSSRPRSRSTLRSSIFPCIRRRSPHSLSVT